MSYQESLKSILKLPDLPIEQLSGCNILVTGATGLIGSTLVEALMNNDEIDYHVFALGRNADRAGRLFSKYSKNSFFHFLKHDIIKPLETSFDFQYIIHAASNASPNFFVSNPVEIVQSNVIGLCNLLEYGRSHNLKRLLYISSGEVYGECEKQIIDESSYGYIDILKSRSCYPMSKRVSETLCVSYAAEFGLNIVIARPCHVYGPRFTENDNRVYAQFLRNIINDEDIIMKSSGRQYRSWCYVVDCISALLFILLKGESCEAYNIASKDSILSIKSFAIIIAEMGGKQVLLTEPSDAESKGYNPVFRSVLSTEKLQSLGWVSSFDIRQGMKETYEFIQCIWPDA